MRTSVVVVSHRVHRWLGDSIASVADQCDEVIVVDNGSDGGAVSRAAREAGARLVVLRRNVGFPGGVNAGVKASTGDVVALLNDDAMAEPGWISSATAVLGGGGVAAVAPKLVFALPFAEVRFDDEPRRIGADRRWLGRSLRSATVGGVEVLPRLVGPGVHELESGVLDGTSGEWRWTSGRDAIYVPMEPGRDASELLIDGRPAHVVGQVRLINNAGSYLSAEGHAGDHGYLAPDDGRFDAPAARFGACGAALVTTADVLARVGPFAAGFFAYYEDVDWCWRARLAGLDIRYEPAGVVHHVGGATSGGPLSQSVKGLAGRNRLACLARNAPLPVVAREFRRALPQMTDRVRPPLPRLRRGALLRPSVYLLTRPLLARRRHLPVREVWDQWAGTDQTW